jgi:hypothetical protein
MTNTEGVLFVIGYVIVLAMVIAAAPTIARWWSNRGRR